MKLILQELKDMRSNMATKEDVEVIRQDLDTVRQDVKVVKQDLDTVRQDVKVVKQDLDTVRQDVKVVKQDLDTVRQDVKVVKQDIEKIKHMITDYHAENISADEKLLEGIKATNDRIDNLTRDVEFSAKEAGLFKLELDRVKRNLYE
ncbi:MAG: hypothetical protein K0Q59_1946 [Paenibacillus sp.]|nr:hypothetical protein [Paenibacillus sp.]